MPREQEAPQNRVKTGYFKAIKKAMEQESEERVGKLLLKWGEEEVQEKVQEENADKEKSNTAEKGRRKNHHKKKNRKTEDFEIPVSESTVKSYSNNPYPAKDIINTVNWFSRTWSTSTISEPSTSSPQR